MAEKYVGYFDWSEELLANQLEARRGGSSIFPPRGAVHREASSMKMAANEVVNSRQGDVERVVNRWMLDYYFSLALDFFQRDQKDDFLDVIHVFEGTFQKRSCSFCFC